MSVLCWGVAVSGFVVNQNLLLTEKTQTNLRGNSQSIYCLMSLLTLVITLLHTGSYHRLADVKLHCTSCIQYTVGESCMEIKTEADSGDSVCVSERFFIRDVNLSSNFCPLQINQSRNM